MAKQWITDNLRPTSNINYKFTAYNLKHMLEKQTGIYLSERDFIDAMISLGYTSKTKDHVTRFNVNSKIRGALAGGRLYDKV